MDSPQSDDERLQEAGAGEALLSKKMKLLIVMLSLVLIILLLPLASNHGLPNLLKPMGISMLQRLWDAMRFIAMTAAISVGIISTSSQRNEKGFDRSAHLRSTSSARRSSTPIASSSRESINPNMINNFDMNRSGPPALSQGRDVNHILHQESWGKEMGNSQKFKGKQVMNDFATVASTSDASSRASREEDIYGLGSPSSQEVNYKQGPTNSRRRLSASDAWFRASRIDEEIEEESIASASHIEFSSGKPLGESRIQSQKKSSPIDEKGLMSNKESKSADRGFMNVYASMTDDNYAELRMRKAAISRLAGENHDATGKGHRRSSSVDRRRPIYYDDQGPDRPGLKQILMDVSKERAFSGKLSNLANKKSLSVGEQSDRPHSAQASTRSSPNIASTLSIQQSMKASVQHYLSTETLPSDLNRIEKHSDADSMDVVHHKHQEAMSANQILQKQTDNAKKGLNEIVQSKMDPNQIRRKQDDAKMGPNQKMQADQAKMHPNQIVQRQDDYQAKVGTTQTLQKQADAKMAFVQTLQKADARTGSDSTSQMQPHGDGKMVSEGVQMQRQYNNAKGSSHIVQRGEEDLQTTLHKANMSSGSKHLLQSSKHSRSALNLEQLEQIGNTLHGKPPARASAKKKKSFSCDFGDGFSPNWLWELEPPPPPGFIDQQTSPTEANQSSKNPNPELKNDSSSTLVQSLVPWRSSVPIDISAYPRATSPASPPDVFSQATGPSPGEVNRRADEFISNFTTRLIKQRQESLERQKRSG